MQRSAASYRFERRLARRSARPLRAPGEIVGVEMEFEVVEHGCRLDFRDLIADVVGGDDRRWFPLDPHARYLPSGAVVTCDGMEAEIATPPVRTRRGHPSAVADEVLARRAELETLVRRFNERSGRSVELRGYSTHLNAFVPEGRAPEVAIRFARTVAPAMMLLLDLASSPGALVRPRARRLEFGGEYVAGRDDLRVALTFFIAATMAAERGLTLPELEGELVEDPSRGGWFVDRTAYGEDLYVEGRMASLRLAGGGRILAGTLLGEAWELARPLIEQTATEHELALVDETVAGARPLPLEREPEPETDALAVAPVQPFARILDERRSGEIVVRPETVSWEAATLKVTTPSRSFYARVPLESYAAFATLFERGSLDKALRSYGARPPRGRIAALSTPGIGLYDAAEMPAPSRGGKPARVTVGDAGAAPPPRSGMVVTVAKRAAILAGAAVMFAGTAAFAYLGLRQAGGSTAGAPQPRPGTSVLAGRESRDPTPSAQSTIPSTAPPSGIVTPAPATKPPVIVVPPPTTRATPKPTPKKTTSSPTPTPTTSSPKPSPKPTPTPTQSQGFQPPAPPPPPTNNSEIAIVGRMSCNNGTSWLSFSVSAAQGGAKIMAMDIQYNNQHLASSPAPNYPYSTYSGTVSAPTGGNKRWIVVAQDQGGSVKTVRFDDIC
ncbi:MAG TPA: hypothetical protein VGB64_00150 [Actinomycetota bacterium]